ncbi:hypothetical protein CASFOL_038937 [Castilleja foliolosa]|uniref:Desiccation-related protein PCC13-62 n=1 Tax=Castilleja foliolosa TaxID=1961234 RepID=A0ABD3BIB5_9LAMI
MAFFTSSAALTAFFLFLLRGGNSQKFVDSDYVELALNLEYLETEFFLYGALGYGLDIVAPGLSMGGPKPYGAQKANLFFVNDIITEFGYQEVGHLRAIKSRVKGFPRPLLNISASNFADFMDAASIAASGQPLNPRFDPYANDINFLIASYAIPYVGLTGYVGAASNLRDAAFKKLVAGLLGVESGQDAVIRTLLNQFAYMPVSGQYTVANFTTMISAQRDRLGNPGETKDEGIIVNPEMGAEGKVSGNVLAGNTESLAYDRSPEQILSIVYATGQANEPGGFFPNGAGGNIAKYYRNK